MARNTSVTHKIMSAIPQKNTKPEMLLRRSLWQAGMRYRVNYRRLPGKPDIVFTRTKIAIFVDGDFWHGHNWAVRGLNSLDEELSKYSDFWKTKIRGNIARDATINEELSNAGWKVIRIWESDLYKNVDQYRDAIIEAHKARIMVR